MKEINNNYTKKIVLKDSIKEMSCEDICDKLKLLIYKLAHNYNNCGEFEDLTQIAYMGLIKAYNNYDYAKGVLFETYASIIIRNDFLIAFRKTKKLNEIESLQSNKSEEGIELSETLNDKVNYENFALNKIAINKVINQAKEIDKQIISLKKKGLSYTDISNKINLSENAISKRLRRVCKKIKEEMV